MSTDTLTAGSEITKDERLTAMTQPASRMVSIDALRGFDMFWIIGAGALAQALKGMNENAFTSFMARQLQHVDWVGFRFYDLIFPLFIFIVGVSSVFSLTKHAAQSGRRVALIRLFRRSLLLYAAGVFYYGGFSNPVSNILWVGVLNRIALCYFFGGLIFLFCKPRMIAAIAVGLLLGYWALMALVPFRDIKLQKAELNIRAKSLGATNDITFARQQFFSTTTMIRGKYEPGYNVANHFDFEYMPGRLHYTYWNPEGVVSTVPSIVTALLGIFAGLLLRSTSITDRRKLVFLFSFGLAGVLLGWLWHGQFPVIKKIWTSSFVLVAGGYSAILLGLFFLIVDVWKFQAWCRPFVWLGMNSITVYMAANIIDFHKLAERFAGGDVKKFFDNHLLKGSGEFVISIVGLLLMFGLARFLFRRQIFLRL